MKKLIFATIFLMIFAPFCHAKMLWEYGNFYERALLAVEYGIVDSASDYEGSYEQNMALLSLLKESSPNSDIDENLGVKAIPTPIALFRTSLASGITANQTTMTLVSATDGDGTTLASSTYGFIIDEGNSNEEFVLANCTGTACSGMTRGVSVRTGTSTVTAAKYRHRRGASVKMSNAPQLIILTNMVSGISNLPNKIRYDSLSISGSDNVYTLVTKQYADNIANQGAATSTGSTAGISRLATQTQMANSTYDADDPLVLHTRYASSTPSTNQVVPVTESDGDLNAGFIGQDQNYTWSGTHSFSNTLSNSATTTFTGTTTLDDITIGHNASAMIASTSITGGALPVPVYIASSSASESGGIFPCDANNQGKLEFVGFAITSASSTETVYIQTEGIVNGFTGLTKGAKYYVQDTEGTIGTTVGTYDVLVGVAHSPTEILIQRGYSEYMGSVTVGNNSSAQVLYNARKLIIQYTLVDTGNSECGGKGNITMTKPGLTTVNVQHKCYTGGGGIDANSEFTWSGTTVSTNNSDLSGSATIYMYK